LGIWVIGVCTVRFENIHFAIESVIGFRLPMDNPHLVLEASSIGFGLPQTAIKDLGLRAVRSVVIRTLSVG